MEVNDIIISDFLNGETTVTMIGVAFKDSSTGVMQVRFPNYQTFAAADVTGLTTVCRLKTSLAETAYRDLLVKLWLTPPVVNYINDISAGAQGARAVWKNKWLDPNITDIIGDANHTITVF